MLAIELSFQVVAIPFCQRLEIGPHISPASRSLFFELREDKVFHHDQVLSPYLTYCRSKKNSRVEWKPS